MLPNLLTFPISFFGSINIGATVVNVNPLFKSREVKILLTDSNVETIVILDKFLNELELVIRETKIKNVIVCRPFDLLNIPMNLIVRTLLFFKTKSPKINRNYILFSDIVRSKEKIQVFHYLETILLYFNILEALQENPKQLF